MFDTFFRLLVWAGIGAIPGFYMSYIKGYRPLLGMSAGAIVSLIVGVIEITTGIVFTPGGGVITIFSLCVIIGLLLPAGRYFTEQATLQKRTGVLAYTLIMPTTVIVLGVVLFPLIWNVLFSIRAIDMADLRDVQFFDVSALTLHNFQSQLGVRVDPLTCVMDDEGNCVLGADGEMTYVDARRQFDNYRGWREVHRFNLGEERYTVGVRNAEFYPMIFRTFMYTVASSILAIGLGLAAALIANAPFVGRNVFRGVLLFPYIAPVISVAFVWQVILRQDGIVNAMFGTELPFLNTGDTWFGVAVPLLMVILFQAWRYFPFAFVFLLARIQAIPAEMYEAARVDGASPLQRLVRITLPQLRAVFGTLLLLRFIWTFNKFDDVFLLTGMNPDTKVLPVAIFEALFVEGNVGKASATAVVLALISGLVVLMYVRFFMIEEDAYA